MLGYMKKKDIFSKYRKSYDIIEQESIQDPEFKEIIQKVKSLESPLKERLLETIAELLNKNPKNLAEYDLDMSERLYRKYGIKFKKWIETKSEEVLDYKERLKILYKEEQNITNAILEAANPSVKILGNTIVRLY
jgi:hypothetical protein